MTTTVIGFQYFEQNDGFCLLRKPKRKPIAVATHAEYNKTFPSVEWFQ